MGALAREREGIPGVGGIEGNTCSGGGVEGYIYLAWVRWRRNGQSSTAPPPPYPLVLSPRRPRQTEAPRAPRLPPPCPRD
jgi:hypothetical protein